MAWQNIGYELMRAALSAAIPDVKSHKDLLTNEELQNRAFLVCMEALRATQSIGCGVYDSNDLISRIRKELASWQGE